MKTVSIEKRIFEALEKDCTIDLTMFIKPNIPRGITQEIKETLIKELQIILDSHLIVGCVNVSIFNKLNSFMINNYKKVFSETDLYDDLHDIVIHRITKRDILYFIDMCHEYISTLLDEACLTYSVNGHIYINSPKIYIDYRTNSTEYFGFMYNNLLKQLDILSYNLKHDITK